MRDLNQLESIIEKRDSEGNKVYSLRFEWEEVTTKTTAMACYTGNMTAGGKLKKSKTNFAAHVSSSARRCDEIADTDKETAKAAGNWAMSNGRYLHKEVLGNTIIWRVILGEAQ